MGKQKNTGAVYANITVGIQLAVTVLLFVYLGYRMDLHYKTSPLFIGIGTVVGMALGFYHLLKDIQRTERAEKEDEKKPRNKWM